MYEGISIDTWCEGVYVTNFEIVHVGIGINYLGAAGHTNPNFYIQNGHINFRVHGMSFTNVLNVKANAVDICKSGPDPGHLGFNGNGVGLSNCNNFSFVDCKFESVQSAGVTDENGLFAHNSEKGVILGCQFLSFLRSSVSMNRMYLNCAHNFFDLVNSGATGVYLDYTSSKCLVTDNIFKVGSGANACLNFGSANTVYNNY